MVPGQDQHRWKEAKALVQDLEGANPGVAWSRHRGAGLPGEPSEILEYPWWREATETVCWPERDLTLCRTVVDPSSQRAALLIRVASALSHRIPDEFG